MSKKSKKKELRKRINQESSLQTGLIEGDVFEEGIVMEHSMYDEIRVLK